MFKAPLTEISFNKFSSAYQSFSPSRSKNQQPFVYVDSEGFKVVTTIADASHLDDKGIFAVCIARDGWVEMLSF